MIRHGWLILGIIAVLCFAGCSGNKLSSAPDNIRISPDIQLKRLSEKVWIHTTWHQYPSGRYPANGLLICQGNALAMIDTPATNEQTAELLDWLSTQGLNHLKVVIPTHFHIDCMGGLSEAHKRGAMSYAHSKTADIAHEKSLPVPKATFQKNLQLQFGSTPLQLYYPGPGHTLDNIVVYLPQEKILFGGCLIKSVKARNLGNTKDGDIQAYPESLKSVMNQFKDAQIIVPGHDTEGGRQLLTHTLKLAEAGKSP